MTRYSWAVIVVPRCAGPVLMSLFAAVTPAIAAVPLASGVSAAADDASAAPGELAGEAPRPNIVMVMIDDADPHDGRLWSAEVMPHLNQLIVSRGIEFTDFQGEVPLCGPSRAALLTGQHAHNSGANSNNGEALDPTETVATELKASGYHTSYVGKYLNGYRRFTPDKYDPPGWSDFDVINSNQGKYYWYQIRDREGNITQHKTKAKDYSTDVIADIAVQRIREAPADQPLFTIIAPFTPHEPDLPAPRHEGDPRCADLGLWSPPNYDEADVSDKPAYIQKLKPLGDGGYDLTAHCESLLAVDDLVGRVGKALDDTGRLDDTVFVFLADNGMTWGEHRRVGKVSPYSTTMPVYAAWPAGRGTEPRLDDTTLSVIDVAPTLCALAGCEMGPYPDGQDAADGWSFASLLEDQPYPYVRDAVLQSVPSGGSRPVWWAVRTTADYPDGRWQYVENRGGFRELYDLGGGPCYAWQPGDPGDPCQLDNLLAERPDDPRIMALADGLSQELRALESEVAPAPVLRPTD
jgi:N-acetylglucosamine-6-sulfatase